VSLSQPASRSTYDKGDENLIQHPVIIVGAGISGIAAALALRAWGIDPLLVDKGRGTGGRLATWRLEQGLADYGAQFFTVRGPGFAKLVERWREDGWVRPWFGGAHPRYIAVGGMNALARRLAGGLQIQQSAKVTAISHGPLGWQLALEATPPRPGHPARTVSESLQAGAVLLTPPVPQSLQLFHSGGTDLPGAVRTALGRIRYTPCVAGLFLLEGPSGIPAPGLLEQGLPPALAKLIDQRAKGVSTEPVVVVHASDDWSGAHYHLPDAELLARLMAICQPLLASPLKSAVLKRWRYAHAESVHPAPYLVVTDAPAPLLFAGDGFQDPQDSAAHARIESAFLSGVAAGNRLGEMLQPPAAITR